jgi:hypothetical protein
MTIDEFWGWVSYLGLKGETDEQRGRRVAQTLLKLCKSPEKK